MKNANQGTKPNNSSKTSKNAQALNKKNMEVTITKAAANEATDKALKYIYPTDVKTPQQKKEFRRTARQSIKKYEKTIARLKASNSKSDKEMATKTEKEYKEYSGKILNATSN